MTNRRAVLRAATGFGLGASAVSLVGKSATVASGWQLPVATSAISEFKVSIPGSDIADLKQRLAQTRWPDAETTNDWSEGARQSNLQGLMEYWKTRYDWRRGENRINAWPQFRTLVDGLGIHFIHARSRHKDALPLLLTHGWPGSVVEFLKTIGPADRPRGIRRTRGRRLSCGRAFASRIRLF